MAQRIQRRYNTPSAAGSFQGPSKLYQSAKKDGENITLRDVRQQLEKENSYTLNRSVINKFPRNHVIVEGYDTQWDLDLGNLYLLHQENDGFKYFLLAIDIFSRYVWVRPVKTKYSKEIVQAIKSIFAEGRKPRSIRTDGGREFQNSAVKSFLAQREVRLFSTNNSTQANYAERAIKTLKTKIYRYLVTNNTMRYIDVIQDLTKSYNSTVHGSLGIPPKDVTKENEDEMRFRQYQLKRKPKNDFEYPKQKMKFNVGDQVRISYTQEPFDTEYSQKWSGEVLVVASRRRRNTIPIYKLNDWYGEPLKGTFYQQQLQKVNIDDQDIFKVEKILKRRRRGGRNQVYLKFLHWPAKYNMWLDEADIIPPP